MEKELHQMTCSPYRRGVIIGAGPGIFELDAEDGHVYIVGAENLVPLKRVEQAYPKEKND